MRFLQLFCGSNIRKSLDVTIVDMEKEIGGMRANLMKMEQQLKQAQLKTASK
jgi:hypothetical protein